MTEQEEELQFLTLSQDWDNPCPLMWDDAFLTVEHRGLMRDTEQDGFSVMSDTGFDESTGVDTALSVQHEGTMLVAGFLMLEGN